MVVGCCFVTLLDDADYEVAKYGFASITDRPKPKSNKHRIHYISSRLIWAKKDLISQLCSDIEAVSSLSISESVKMDLIDSLL